MTENDRLGPSTRSLCANALVRVRRLISVCLAAVVTWWGIGVAAAESAPVTPTGQFATVSVGYRHACALTRGGDAMCWGANYQRQAPSRVVGPFTSVSAAGDHTCAVRQDRSISCWGGSSSGAAPPRVAGSFQTVSAGGLHTCALGSDGDLVCWGSNTSGAAPVRVAGPFLSVSSGGVHTCAVRADQNVVCWGSNSARQAPREVVGPFTAVDGGGSSTCALRVDGDITCWGSNEHGQAPPKVVGPFTSLSVGMFHACAVRSSGSLACWGDDELGQAPDDAVGPFASVSVDGAQTCGVREDRTLTCWGDPLALPAPPPPPQGAPATATVGEYVHHVFVAPAASQPRFSVTGNLPPGLALAANGHLTGIPRSPGTFAFTVSATNQFGTTRTSFSLRVKPTTGFDANSDGRPDLVIGVPEEDVARVGDAGVVTILYGAADGTYGRAGSLQLDQRAVGQASEKGDRFGASLALGEVTGDRYVDLVIGAPGEDAGAGMVVVVPGSATGLSRSTRTVLRQGRDGAAGTAERGDGFGAAVSVGQGLWVGAPGENLGRATDAGVVTRFAIQPLRTAGSVQYRQGARRIPGKPERGDRFGAALSGGGFVIGAPGEDVGGRVDAGAITVNLRRSVTQNSAGVPGKAERGDHFGAAVVALRLTVPAGFDVYGDFTQVAVGAPGEDVSARKDAGSVTLAWEFSPGDGYLGEFRSVSPSPGKPESGDRFGAAVAFSTDGSTLVVGAPGEDVGSHRNAGAVTVLPLYNDSCDEGCWVSVASNVTTLVQGRSGVPGRTARSSAFGSTVGGIPGIEQGLVVGAPGARIGGRSSAGAVAVVKPGLRTLELHQNQVGVPGTAEKGDRFSIVANP